METKLLKDQETINNRNESNYAKGFQMLHSAFVNDELLGKIRPHIPHHTGCPGLAPAKGDKEVEKQICRCMFYYGSSNSPCATCGLQQKWHLNDNHYEIVECEYPTPFVIESLGGIDLLVRNKESMQLYMVEVKPPKSEESIMRMMAETLTYQASVKAAAKYWSDLSAKHKTDSTLFDELPDAIPAIAFFEGSIQDKDWGTPWIHNDPNCQAILQSTGLTVFRITSSEAVNGVHDVSFHVVP